MTVTIDPTISAQLTELQRAIAEGVASGHPPVHVLQGAPGTGKSFLAAKLAAAFLDAGESVLLIANPLVAEQIATRTGARGPSTPVRITKAEARTRDSPSGDAPLIGMVAPGILRHASVADEISTRRWGLTIVDFGREMSLDAIEPLLARGTVDRLLVLASIDLPDLTPLTMSGIEPAIWSTPRLTSLMQEVEAQFEVVPYRRSDSDIALIEITERLVTEYGQLLPEVGLALLPRAAASSPFALQARALRLLHRIRASRNLAAHGQLRLIDEAEPKQQEQMLALFHELERIVIGVDRLEHDAKLEALMAAMGRTETGGGVVFFGLSETADYADQSLRLNGMPSLRIERSASAQDLIGSERQGAFLLAVDQELVGLDLRELTTAINYDIPQGPRNLYARIARLAGGSPRVLTLIDQSKSSRVELRALDRLPVLRGRQRRLWD